MNFSPLMEAVHQHVERSHGLLQHERLVVCLGNRLALTLFISALRPGHPLVGAATTAAEGLELVQQQRASLLLCSDQLEQGDGGRLVAAVKALPQAPNTLMIVSQPRRLSVIRTALEASCDGLCLEAKVGQGTVLQALTTVSQGAVYVDRALNGTYRQLCSGLEDQPLAPLSRRELEVLQLVTSGTPNPEIAATLQIGLETVKTHMRQILQKLQARDRTHAAVKGLWLGLVEWPESR